MDTAVVNTCCNGGGNAAVTESCVQWTGDGLVTEWSSSSLCSESNMDTQAAVVSSDFNGGVGASVLSVLRFFIFYFLFFFDVDRGNCGP